MIKNKIITFIILISISTPLLVGAAIPILQSGAEVQKDLDTSAEIQGFNTYSQNEMMSVRMKTINTIISYALSFIGIIFLINIIIGGFKWMTAGGNEEKITSAKHTVNNSILALIIVLGAYIISNLITQLISLF
ncbi:MAG: hypothetical protein PHZ07_01150 [Patescibacteria group bacterium]|nr:hypothetical protein [Patescibacteria group bacterium]MDD4303956.1 hypothetical protein [Patescibacteria group bacterium]MDD4695055.1 hypothetical protein [Patescibacteria group bacterium]